MIVSGYYGCGNSGDEAVLAGIRESFRLRAGTKVEIVALSQSPAITEQSHGIRAVNRMNFWELRKAIKESSLLLSGGGSLFQDSTSFRSLLYYLWVAQIAYSQGVPVMFYAQGMGPFHRRLSRILVRVTAERASYITVRDEPSLKLLKSLGVRTPPMEVTADPAFALSPAPADRIEDCWKQEGLPGMMSDLRVKRIAVALRAWGVPSDERIRTYGRLLTEIKSQTGAQVFLLPMQVPEDVRFSEAVAAATLQPNEFPIIRQVHSPELVLGLVSRMDAIVAMRLHTLIFAARAAIPFFALSYDPKVENLMQRLDMMEFSENWDGFDPSEVARKVNRLVEEKRDRSNVIRARGESLERLALRNTDCALNLLAKTNTPHR